MPAPKQTPKNKRTSDNGKGVADPCVREMALERVAAYKRQGMSNVQIARLEKVSGPQVTYDIKLIAKRYAESAQGEWAEHVGEVVAGLRDVRREAWAEWERTKRKRARVKTTTEEGDGPKGESSKTVKTVDETDDPALECLRIIQQTWMDEAQVRGLLEKKVKVSGGLNWEVLVGEIDQANQERRTVEQRIVEGLVIEHAAEAADDKVAEADQPERQP